MTIANIDEDYQQLEKKEIRGRVLDLAFETVVEKTEAGSSVVLILDSVKECNQFRQDYFVQDKGIDKKIAGYHSTWCFVFNANAKSADRKLNRSILADIQKTEAQNRIPKLILTTPYSAMGVNLFKKCEVILTEIPATINDLHQMVGRSNRVDYTEPKYACLISKVSGLNLEGIIKELKIEYLKKHRIGPNKQYQK